jgi:hypothetical protein
VAGDEHRVPGGEHALIVLEDHVGVRLGGQLALGHVAVGDGDGVAA